MDKDLVYALVVLGGGVLFWIGWWLFCLIVRLGINGMVAMSHAINEKRLPALKKILLGTWLKEGHVTKQIGRIQTRP